MAVSVLSGDDMCVFSGLTDLGKDKPKELWIYGEKKRLQVEDCAAVVGSRRMSSYGLRVTEMLVGEIVSRGKTVVSGFMSGVDMAAHKRAVEIGGVSIAVLGWGIRNQFSNSKIKSPKSKDSLLAEEIITKGGMVISEWENQNGAVWTFPRRNRLVAAIAGEVYVVEASLDSGSLITADWAVKLKRKLFAVPGPINSILSFGTNKLIADGKAQLWLPNQKQKLDKNRYINHIDIYTLLQNDISEMDDMVRSLHRNPEDISRELTLMELEGLVRRTGGKYELVDYK